MQTIRQYDHVRLKDGREEMVIEIFDDPELFLVNLDSSQEHGETITVYKEDIQIPNEKENKQLLD